MATIIGLKKDTVSSIAKLRPNDIKIPVFFIAIDFRLNLKLAVFKFYSSVNFSYFEKNLYEARREIKMATW